MPELTNDYNIESNRVKQVLRAAFPHDTIATDPGYNGRVHVKVVSEKFNGKTEQEKQQIIWEILNDELQQDSQAVSLALAYGTDEL